MQIEYKINMEATLHLLIKEWRHYISEPSGFTKIEQFKVGMILQHSGFSSGLYNQVGVVTDVFSSSVEVTWLVAKNGNGLVNSARDLELRRSSKYTSDWMFENLDIVTGVEVVMENMESMTMSEAHGILDEDYKSGEYILWGPQGNQNPSEKHRSLAEADNAALAMSKRHKATFYVCKLVGKATHKVTVTSTLVKV